MLILMRPDAESGEVESVPTQLRERGIRPQVTRTEDATCILAPDASKALRADQIGAMAGVLKVVPISSPFKLASLDGALGRTVVEVNGVRIGGETSPSSVGPAAWRAGSSSSRSRAMWRTPG